MDNTINTQAASQAVDLTPPMMASPADRATPVLVINPAATTQQRAQLSHMIAGDALVILEAGLAAHGHDSSIDRAVLCSAIERVHQLEVLLGDLRDRAAAAEGGAA